MKCVENVWDVLRVTARLIYNEIIIKSSDRQIFYQIISTNILLNYFNIYSSKMHDHYFPCSIRSSINWSTFLNTLCLLNSNSSVDIVISSVIPPWGWQVSSSMLWLLLADLWRMLSSFRYSLYHFEQKSPLIFRMPCQTESPMVSEIIPR